MLGFQKFYINIFLINIANESVRKTTQKTIATTELLSLNIIFCLTVIVDLTLPQNFKSHL